MRRDDNENAAFFKLHYGIVLAVLGILICIGLLFSSKANEFKDTIITLLVGVAIFGINKSFKNKKQKVNDMRFKGYGG